MRVTRVATTEELIALAPQWNDLAGDIPMRTWHWQGNWWLHYGSPAAGRRGAVELFVLCVHDTDNQLVGLAPWYIQPTKLQGRVVRFLASGEACSDHQSVLCRPGFEREVATAFADWLLDDRPTVAEWLSERRFNHWDLLEFSGVDSEDCAMREMTNALAARGAITHCRAGSSCWRLPLPAEWHDYVAILSKSHRKIVRRLQRTMFDTGRALLHEVKTHDDLTRAFAILVDLHARRRNSLGKPGVFDCGRFAAFHRDAARGLLGAGQLRLSWLELDSRPVAAEYNLASKSTIFSYQSGIAPDALAQQPGRLAMIATLRRAIAEGCAAFDFLRGDEPYKAHWRATPCASVEVRVWPGKTVDWFRHSMWKAGESVKDWVRSGKRFTASLR
jgi:Acetyltransferase (GNAT) domain